MFSGVLSRVHTDIYPKGFVPHSKNSENNDAGMELNNELIFILYY